MNKTAKVACIGILLLTFALAGCTRAKPEPVTPTVAISVATSAATTSSPTATPMVTAQAQPTALSPTPGPTVISVAEVSPSAVAVVSPTVPAPTAVAGQFEYTVQWYDTLFSIAQRFGTTVDAILALNGLQDPNYIRIGQVLQIPGTVPPPSTPAGQYVVQAGDTLYSIALRFNTTVEAIQRANGIVNPWYINVGQTLIIPGGSSEPSPGGTTYTVQVGDTLYSIAARFGKTTWDLVVANNLSNPSLIFVGQVLVIP